MFEDRIAKGIAWLEKYDGSWFNKINLDALCMSKNDGCVLGQWYRGDCSDKFSYTWCVERGFSLASTDIKDAECKIEWVLLANEWRKIIQERRRSLEPQKISASVTY